MRPLVRAWFRSLTSLHPLDGGVRVVLRYSVEGAPTPKRAPLLLLLLNIVQGGFNGKFVYDTLYATPTVRAHSSTSIRLTDTIIITSCTIKLIHTFISPLLSTVIPSGENQHIIAHTNATYSPLMLIPTKAIYSPLMPYPYSRSVTLQAPLLESGYEYLS